MVTDECSQATIFVYLLKPEGRELPEFGYGARAIAHFDYSHWYQTLN
jgi:hypothetical protein